MRALRREWFLVCWVLTIAAVLGSIFLVSLWPPSTALGLSGEWGRAVNIDNRGGFEAGITGYTGPIIISSTQYLSGNSYTISSPSSLQIMSGATFSSKHASGTTVTINVPLSVAGVFPWINSARNSTGVTVIFGAKANAAAHPEYWAANSVPGSTDMLDAWELAVTAVKDSTKRIVCEPQIYAMSRALKILDVKGLTISSIRGQPMTTGARLKGLHGDRAVLELTGSQFISLTGIELEGGNSGASPYAGLIVGRSSAASAGGHTFTDVSITGYFQWAGLYNVASEGNTWINPFIYVSGVSVAGAYYTQDDDFVFGGLVGSSMEQETVLGGTIATTDSRLNTSAVYIHAGSATGHFLLINTMLGMSGGSAYVTFKFGSDAGPTLMPITLDGVLGEESSTSPYYGVHLINTNSMYAGNLSIRNGSFNAQQQTLYCSVADAGSGVHLMNADISTRYRASGGAPSTLNRVDGSRLFLGSEPITTSIAQAYGCDIMATVAPTIATGANNIIRPGFNATAYPTFGTPRVESGTTLVLLGAGGNESYVWQVADRTYITAYGGTTGFRIGNDGVHVFDLNGTTPITKGP